MLGVFDAVKAYFKSEKIKTDNKVFRLHSQLTVGFLLVCALIVSIQYVGKPIHCTVNDKFDDAQEEVMNTFCWITSTYTIPNLIQADGSAAHPGVGPKQNQFTTKLNNATIQHDDTVKYHTYYQWVIFVLIFQAFLFYLPKLLWSIWESGRLAMLAMDMHHIDDIVEYEKKEDQRQLLFSHFVKCINHNNNYFYYFSICELLNFINVVAQIFFVDMFLGYEFTTYGTEVLDFMDKQPGDRNDPMNIIFPKVTKCTFNMIGASGNIIPHDGLCVLQLNIYNEKIYVFLWFWFIILASITGLALIHRLFTYFLMPVRVLCLKRKSHTSSLSTIRRITKFLPIGDWFLLYQLSENMDGLIYHQLVEDLAKEL